MIIDLKKTENKILEALEPLCENFSFMRRAHPGSLKTLGFPINNVTALLRFLADEGDRPDNLNAPCINQIKTLKMELHTVWINYQGHHKIYDLAKAISNQLRGRRDLIVFCDGVKNTAFPTYIENFRFLEIAEGDSACFSYSFDLVLPYAETYFTVR